MLYWSERMSDYSTRTIVRAGSAPSSVRVDVVGGPSTGIATLGRKITVGRARVADIAVDDYTVSEFHLEISPHEGGIEVRDLESWNGTFVEGVRVMRAVVPRGTILALGESAIRVDVANEAKPPPPVRDSYRGILGKSIAMRELFGFLERLASTDLGVLIQGPTGSGKELVARALHDDSARAGGPFSVLDCAALPASLAETVLFGHVAGAFTGAVEDRMGVFESANGGTVFLDEVGELPLDLQPKLLRVLEQRQVTRIGENRPRPIDVRVVSATWRDLRRMVNQGQFRDDLYYRLAQTRLELPALVERRDDIEPLVASFLRRLPRKIACARSISREALAELAARDWPGNVRELKATVERAALMCDGPVIRPQDLAFERLLERSREIPSGDDTDSDEVPDFKGAKRTAIDDFERDYLVRLVTKTNHHMGLAASLAGIERHYLRALLKKHGLGTRE